MKIRDARFYSLVRDFFYVYLDSQKGASPYTIKSYRETINLLLDYVSSSQNIKLMDISIEQISPQAISRFLTHLEADRNCTAASCNRHLAAIRSLLKYCGMQEPVWNVHYIKATSIPFKKTAKVMAVNHFSETALKAILQQPNAKSRVGHRNLFYMILLYDTGARDSELLGLKTTDVIDKTGAPYVYIHGKGNKDRVVPIMKETLVHYNSYMKRFHRDTEANDYLFYVIQHGERQQMSDDNVGKFISKYAAAARLVCPEVPERVTPHMFRHSRALSLYRNGMPLVLISEWLGHAHTDTTLIYAYADTEMKRAAIEKATQQVHPLRNQQPTFQFEKDEETLKRLYGLA